MADKVRFLKIESPSEGGTQTDYLPTEADPTEDYGTMKGIALNDDTSFLIDHVGRTIAQKEPYTTYKATYLANGEIDYIEFFNSDTQINANRVYRTAYTYNGSLDMTQAVTSIYDTDGTTVLRTITEVHTYTNSDVTNTTVTIS